jgi:hypothetical protein
MASKLKPIGSTGEVMTALRVRYARPAWAVFDEVGNSTGFHCSRHADMVAFSLWPSRGLELHGIEVKSSRSDWLRELKDPAKSDPIQKFCDRWYLAISGDAIVQPGEVPPTWGLLVLRGEKLVCVTEAPMLTPEPLSKAFMAALVRRVDAGAHRAKEEASIEGYKRGQLTGPDAHAVERDSLRRQVEALKETLADFERNSGLKIDKWTAGNIGDAVARLRSTVHRGHCDPVSELTHHVEQFERTAKRLRDELKVMQSVANIAGELPAEQRAAFLNGAPA